MLLQKQKFQILKLLSSLNTFVSILLLEAYTLFAVFFFLLLEPISASFDASGISGFVATNL
jgi:hypothetical protein